MHLHDINGSDGPFWALYQETRRRDQILDDPDFVPFWFLEKLARTRIAAARVALEKFGTPQADQAHAALKTLEQSLGAGLGMDDREQIVLGILGAEEEETHRELRDAAVIRRFEGCSFCHRELGSNSDCERCLAARDARWLSDAFSSVLRSPSTGTSAAGQKLALARSLYPVVRDDQFDGWEERLPRVIRFWGGEPPLRPGPLAYSIKTVEAWLSFQKAT